jgi:hypothetical protein
MKKDRAEIDARYYKKNKEKIAEAKKIYLENNKEKTRATTKKYRENNREKINERQRTNEKCIQSRKQWREKNKEKVYNQKKQWYENNKEKNSSYCAEYRNKNLKAIIVRNALYRSKKKGLEHSITEDDIIIPEKCPALGIILDRKCNGQRKSKAFSPSLDRLDAAKGYTKENINIISFRANTIKSDATFEEFEAIYKWWKAELKKRKKKPCPNTTSE